MTLKSYLYNKLKRETSSGNYIPEIDGLRFLAVIVVILFHIQLFYEFKTPYVFNYENYLYKILQNGFKGVELFFVISGIVLALPFANHFLVGGKKPILKNYYLRRLTRLEPPYFLTLLIFFILHVVKNVYPIQNLLKGLLINLLYFQNFAWFHFQPFKPIIGNITWSLEVEIQFYLIAPFLATVFALNKFMRRLVLISTIFGIPIINSIFISRYTSLYNYLFYFLIGFLIVDLYLTEKKIWLNDIGSFIIGVVALVTLYLINLDPLINKLIFLSSLFCFVYLAITTPIWRSLFSNKLFTTIGGMCYTIYLFHTVVISGFGNKTVFWKVGSSYELNILFQTLILMVPILCISTISFVLIEKPFMNKNWPSELINYVIQKYIKIKQKLFN